MASIHPRSTAKRKDGRPVRVYDVKWRDGRRQRSRTFTRESDARLFKAQLNAGTQAATTAAVSATPTVAHMHAEWTAARRVSRSRQASERSHGRHLLDALGPVPVDRLTSLDVRSWIAGQVDAGCAAESISARLRMLRQVLDAAIEAGHCTVNVAARVRPPRISRPPLDERDVLDAAEVAALIAHLPDRWRALVGLLAYVGPRWSEALAVSAADVDLLRRRVHLGHRVLEEVDGVQTLRAGGKTRGSDRWVPLPAPAAELLEHHLASYAPNRAGLLFVGAHGGSPYRSPFRQRVLDPALEAAGLSERGLSVRKLRHTAASLMLDSQMSVVDVARRLGHSRPSTTLDIYARFLPDREDAATRSYEESLAAGRIIEQPSNTVRRQARPAEGQ